MTPDDLRSLVEITEYPPVGHGPEFQAGWDRFGEADDWLKDHASSLALLCAKLGEALWLIRQQSTRHLRATSEAEYVIRDLEFITEYVDVGLAKLDELEATHVT
jgi:hypothetical protein